MLKELTKQNQQLSQGALSAALEVVARAALQAALEDPKSWLTRSETSAPVLLRSIEGRRWYGNRTGSQATMRGSKVWLRRR